MIDFEHLVDAALEVKRLGLPEWRDLSRRERAFVALALNKADWLLTIGQALDLVGLDLLALVPAVERAVSQ